jgi:hypothetical protein
VKICIKTIKFGEHGITSLLPKSMNSRLTKMLDKASKVKGGSSNSKYMFKKLLQDSDNLEKFYTDREYLNELESASSPT